MDTKILDKQYLETLKDRSKKSHVYKKYQLTGLLIAQLLEDEKHKSLYIKLAKKHNNQHLLSIAKDVSERKRIKNKGGYFMRILEKTHPYILKNLKSEAQNQKKNSNHKSKIKNENSHNKQ